MSGVCKQPLNSLIPGAQNTFVIGIIISSSNMRTIDATRSRFNYGERGVWTFTLRDSETDIINVTVWGSVEFVRRLSNNFHIGSVVEVINPKVVQRRLDDKNELFVPSVSGCCSLTVNEGSSLVQLHDSPLRDSYAHLLKLPIRNFDHLSSLQSVLENLDMLQDQYVDVLVVVTFISSVRNLITRDGRYLRCRNFEATDSSINGMVPFNLWENEWIDRADCWSPKETVLLLSDARVAYDNFRKKISLSIVKKTLIIENPDIPQADTLRNAVQFHNFDIMSNDTFAVPNPESITTVMTIREISNKLNKTTKAGERIQFATILKAYPMELNVDSTCHSIILTKCALCKRIVQEGQESCMNLECPSGNGSRKPMNLLSFNLRMNLKDGTGYLIGCRLAGEFAERALNCTAAEFQTMTLPQRTDLKWKYVLEKCDVRLHILGPTATFQNAVYNILSISRIEEADEEEEEDGESFTEN